MTHNRTTKQYICLTLLLLFNLCLLQAQNTLSGTISKPDGVPIENVVVLLDGTLNNDITWTDNSGYYEFSVPTGGNYIITPMSGEYFSLNGVSTFDAVLISQHIDSIQLFDSPFQYIAADVDGSQVIDTFDVLTLFDSTNILNVPSWQFVDQNFVFPVPDNPWVTAIPSNVAINTTSQDISGINFTGVKTGDVNCSAIPYISFDPCILSCGNVYGMVNYDLNKDCTFDNGELNLENWTVEAISNSLAFYATVNQAGEFAIPVYPGDYTVSVIPPNDLWAACQSFDITIDESEEINIDFSIQSVVDCPALKVEMVTPAIRPCFDDGYYSVQYFNHGTLPAIDAYVEVELHSDLSVDSTSIPWTSVNGNMYTFDLGDVNVNNGGTFYIYYTTDCDVVLGSSLCSEAHIYPDTICPPPPSLWDGSNIELTGYCDGDSITFEIINTGDPMSQAVEFIVIEDDMIMLLNDPIQLGPQEEILLSFPANGSTWRVEIVQTENNPYNSQLSATVEGCGNNIQGGFSTGFVTMFPLYDEGNFHDIDCGVATNAYDPNDKSAIPVGYSDQHYIEPNVDLEYLIRFQNTGTDTAFNVVIIDTLSNWLNPSSIQPGPSSHPYTLSLSGENVAKFIFSNIMLPDSNINEVKSHGFIKFNISQQTDVPLESLITNDAGIYFDYNAPIITNEVFHTIGENFLVITSTSIYTPEGQAFKLSIQPNPMNNYTQLTLEGKSVNDGTFLLYDVYGRKLLQQEFSGSTFDLYRKDWSEGIYIFEVREGGVHLGTGKLMVR